MSADGSESWLPVGRFTISKYLDTQGRDRRIRVYAMDRRTTATMLDASTRKHGELGVILQWNDGSNFSWFRDYTRQLITQNEYNFNSAQIEELLARPEYNRPVGANCSLVALAGFKLDIFGRVGARLIDECDEFPADCATPGRTDRCCNTIDRCESSGVIYRDVYPTDIFPYVLAHEIGHYLGLCHCGHDGFQNVMFSSRANTFLDWGLFSYYYESAPVFSLEDGKNAWRFIVDQLASCLTGAPEPVCEPGEVIRKVSAISCAVPKEPGVRRHVRVAAFPSKSAPHRTT